MKSDFVVLHLITNGENPAEDSIIAVEAKKFEKGQEVDSFYSYVKPLQPLSSTITLLTDIHNLDVMNAPPIDEVLSKLALFVESYPLIMESVYEIDFLNSALSGVDPDIDNRLINLRQKLLAEYPDCKNLSLLQMGISLGVTTEKESDLDRIAILYNHFFVEAKAV